MIIQAPKGTKDVLPNESYKWQYLEKKIRKLTALYGCSEIRTPMFEHTELFIRGVGETTDVVQKEMYTFDDKGKRSITLKAEGTAPAVRAFIENSLYNEVQPTKLYYITPVFRYENVQKGRLRQHHQFGVEIYGASQASIDAEVICIAMKLFKDLGIKELKLNINSIGCPNCRKQYNEALKEYLKCNYEKLCDTCKTRYEKNPMRILDCKEFNCGHIVKNAPVILDYICDSCKNHFEELQSYLTELEISYEVDPHIVRGLDYYNKTVFEIINNGITVCGGGRYDSLIAQCDGPEMPAVGFGLGIERLLMTLEQQEINIDNKRKIDIYIGSMGDAGKKEAFKLSNQLRNQDLSCECDHMNRSVKAQMKYANKTGVKFTMILGDEEITTRIAKIKNMNTGEQNEISIDDLNNIKNICLALQS